MLRRGSALDLADRDVAEVGHRRIGAIGRLLLHHRQHRAQVLAAGVDALRREGGLDVARPALAVVQCGRQLAQQFGVHLLRRALRFAGSQASDAEAQSEQRGDWMASWDVRHAALPGGSGRG